MRQFSRTSLPDSIKYNGETYTMNGAINGAMHSNDTPITAISATLKREGRKCVVVNVLSRNLRQATDLRGKPYKPTVWIFTNK